MGTRADFYVGRGKNSEWIGSIAWDGYPEGMTAQFLGAATLQEFEEAISRLQGRKDWTSPEQGWPWPWDDSNTTDYAYAFDDGAVHASCFGSNWFDPRTEENEDGERDESNIPSEFPNMAERKNITMGNRSGVIFVTAKS